MRVKPDGCGPGRRTLRLKRGRDAAEGKHRSTTGRRGHVARCAKEIGRRKGMLLIERGSLEGLTPCRAQCDVIGRLEDQPQLRRGDIPWTIVVFVTSGRLE